MKLRKYSYVLLIWILLSTGHSYVSPAFSAEEKKILDNPTLELSSGVKILLQKLQGNYAYRDDSSRKKMIYAYNLKESSSFYYNQGKFFLFRNNLSQAVLHLQFALAVDPACLNCYKELAYALYLSKEYVQLFSLSSYVIEHIPMNYIQSLEYLYYLAYALYFDKQYQESINVLESIISMYEVRAHIDLPKNEITALKNANMPAYILISCILMERNPQSPNIVNYLMEAIKNNYDKAFLNYLLGEYYSSQKNNNKSLEFKARAKYIQEDIENTYEKQRKNLFHNLLYRVYSGEFYSVNVPNS